VAVAVAVVVVAAAAAAAVVAAVVVVVAAGDQAPALRTMGYDLRITRALDWGANKGREISTEEWLAVVQEDDDLTADPASGPFAVRYGESRWFDWYEGNVFTTDPDHATVASRSVCPAPSRGTAASSTTRRAGGREVRPGGGSSRTGPGDFPT
jgi:hypothetical protein